MKLIPILLLVFMLLLIGCTSPNDTTQKTQDNANSQKAMKNATPQGSQINGRPKQSLGHLAGSSRQKVFDAVSKLGGTVSDDESGRGIVIILKGDKISNSDLEQLETITDLTMLYLVRAPVTDDCIVHLKKLTSLRKLQLQETKISRDGVKLLRAALPKCEILW